MAGGPSQWTRYWIPASAVESRNGKTKKLRMWSIARYRLFAASECLSRFWTLGKGSNPLYRKMLSRWHFSLIRENCFQRKLLGLTDSLLSHITILTCGWLCHQTVTLSLGIYKCLNLHDAGLEGFLLLGLFAFESSRFQMRWNHFGLKRIYCLSQTRVNNFVQFFKKIFR